MELEKVIIVLDGISYQGVENFSINWNKCDLCDFYKKRKCVANKDLLKFCNAFDNVYWQDTFVSITTNMDNFFETIDMTNILKREGIYKNEGF